MVAILLTKILSSIGIIILTIVFALWPVLHKRFKQNDTLISITSAFSGGLFFAISLLVMFPESQSFIDQWQALKMNEEFLKTGEMPQISKIFPWNFFGGIISFTLVLMIGKVLFATTQTTYIFAIGMSIHATLAGLALGMEQNTAAYVGLLIAIIAHKWAEALAIGIRFTKIVRIHHETKPVQNNTGDKIDNQDAMKNYDAENCSKPEVKPELQIKQAFEGNGNEHSPIQSQKSVEQDKLEESKKDNKVNIEIGCVNVCSLVEVVDKFEPVQEEQAEINDQKITKCKAIVILLIFATATPIGMYIGIGISNCNELFRAVAMGVSAGTYLYISLMEILVEEFANKNNKWWKLLAYSIGVGLASCIWLLENQLGED